MGTLFCVETAFLETFGGVLGEVNPLLSIDFGDVLTVGGHGVGRGNRRRVSSCRRTSGGADGAKANARDGIGGVEGVVFWEVPDLIKSLFFCNGGGHPTL